MILTGYDGRIFADLNVDAGLPAGYRAGASINAITIDRAGLSPVHVGTSQSGRVLTVEFIVVEGANVETTLLALLGALQPGNPDARTMVAELNDGTEIECALACGTWRENDANGLVVDFYGTDDVWRERTDTIIPEASISGPTAIPLTNRGGAPALPLIKVAPSTQRTTESSTVGWKYRKQVTITNDGDDDWHRVRVTIDFGDHAALVTAVKSQADGDDIRVRIEGQPSSQELNRTLTNVNTKRTFIHVFVTIPAGQSQTLDVVYGNPDATAPAYTLSTRGRTKLTYAADDLEGSSGTATAGAGTTLTDAGKAWEVNRWRTGFIQITGGTGSGQRRQIATNTATVITVNRAWSTNPSATSTYVIWRSGISVDGGSASAGSATTLTDASQAWSTNQWKGATLTNVTKGTTATITSNTATVLTHNSITANAAADVYYLERYGILNYHVDTSVLNTAHRGLWRINKYNTKGSNVWYGDLVPGGWVPWLMLQNNDDFAQARYVDEGSGTVENFPITYARRAVRSDNTWSEEGQADGVLLFDPRAFIGVYKNYRYRNDADAAGVGLGSVVMMTQQPDGDDWQTELTNSTIQAGSLAAVSAAYQNFTGDTSPNKIYFGVLPNDGVEIPSTVKKGNRIELRTGTIFYALLDITDCGGMTGSVWAVGSEQAVYDLRATLRIGGGYSGDKTPPYDLIELDTILQFGGVGYEAWLQTDPSTGDPLLAVYSSLGDLQRQIPWCATITHHEYDQNGDDTALVTRSLPPIPISNNLLGVSEDTISGWTFTPGAGVTAAATNSAVQIYGDGTGSIRLNFTALPVGAWSATFQSGYIDLIPGSTYEFGLAALRSGLTSGVTVTYTATWGYGSFTPSIAADPPQGVTANLTSNTRWYPVGSGRTTFAGPPQGTIALDEATSQVQITIAIIGSGATTGSVYLDEITMGVPNLYIDEDEIGVLDVTTIFRKGWIA